VVSLHWCHVALLRHPPWSHPPSAYGRNAVAVGFASSFLTKRPGEREPGAP